MLIHLLTAFVPCVVNSYNLWLIEVMSYADTLIGSICSVCR